MRTEREHLGDIDAELWNELIVSYPAVLALFRVQLARNRWKDAEDLAQDTIVAAAVSLTRAGREHAVDLPRYVLGVARHKLADARRAAYRARRYLVPADDPLEAIADRRAHEIAIEHRLLEVERRRRLANAADQLAPIERDLLRLCYEEGLPHGKACDALGIDPVEGSRIKYRAFRRLSGSVSTPAAPSFAPGGAENG